MGHPVPPGLALGIHGGIISVPNDLGSLAVSSAAVAHTASLGMGPLCVYWFLSVNIPRVVDSLIHLHCNSGVIFTVSQVTSVSYSGIFTGALTLSRISWPSFVVLWNLGVV